MDLKSPHSELDREDLEFISALGWLTALAFAVVTFVPLIFDSAYVTGAA